MSVGNDSITAAHIVMQNKRDPHWEALFDDLMGDVFGLSFAPWFAMDCWEPAYESYALFDQGRMVSNVCTYKMRMMVAGKALTVHQTGAVATRDDHRRRGYSSLLMRHVHAVHDDAPHFLFSSPAALPVYPKVGYAPHALYLAEIDCAMEGVPGHALPMERVDEKARALVIESIPQSSVLDVEGAPVVLFNLMAASPQERLYIPSLDTIVVASQADDVLTIDGVISRTIHTIEEIMAFLPYRGVRRVRFGFQPDLLGVHEHCIRYVEETDAHFFVRGTLPLPAKPILPRLKRT